MIEFSNIELRIQQQTLLQEANLSIAPGEKVVIRGTSGCGKSSLLKTVVGAIPLTGGTISVDGHTLSASTVAAIRSRVAFIGQEPALGADRVRDAVMLPFTFKAHKERRPSDLRVIETLERLHLPETILAKASDRVSGGEKQRIAIARALLLNKAIFIADEVTSALDPESRTAVMEELFAPHITLLSVSHDSEWVDRSERQVEIVDHAIQEAG